MRRALAVIVAVVAVGATPAAASTGRLVDVSDPGSFPDRNWILQLPSGASVDPVGMTVEENGEPVAGLHVNRAGESGDAGDDSRDAFGTVLVIDTSESMHGASIAGAMKAARAFADRRKPDQALGVVTFNRRARVVLAPTTDGRAIDEALGRIPKLAPDTYMHDGVATALDVLRATGVRAGSVVVLSDGDDTGSRATQAAIIQDAKREGVRLFTIGLRSNVYTPTALKHLADETGGTAAVADSPRALRGVFAGLSEQLGGEFLVRYRSAVPTGERVRVELDVNGGAPEAVARYRTPSEALTVPPGSRSEQRFWGSSAAVAAVTLFCAMLVGLLAAMVVRRPGQEVTLHSRVTEYAPAQTVIDGPGLQRPLKMADGFLERTFSAQAWWERFAEEVEIAKIQRAPGHLLLAGLGAAVLFLGLTFLTGSPFLLIGAVLPPLAMWLVIRILAGRQRRTFADQLADNLQVFASALRAGHSFTGALGTVIEDAPDPTKREFTRALGDERLGVPIDEALTRIGRRMQNREMTQVAMIASLQQETGGNTAEVLDRVVENVRERQELKRLVRSLTAQGRISQLVVTALPVAIGLVMLSINPEYLDPLFHTKTGQMMLGVGVVMMILGSAAIKKIVDIKV